MSSMKFEFSDTIAGYVIKFDKATKIFGLRTTDGREFSIKLSDNIYARMIRNLGEPYFDCTGQLGELLAPDQYLFVYGTFYPENNDYAFEAQYIDFPGRNKTKFRFEESDWWVKQSKSIAEFFIKAQFGSGDTINYDNYRTTISLTGEQEEDTYRQETDTISRLIFGFASVYLLTGEDVFLEAAEKGTAYLRDHMRFYDYDENIIYWYHGIDVKGGQEHKVFTSEFGDDYDAIPMYEQIYALAGPTQTYRINGDPTIMKDIKMTIELFDRFFLDNLITRVIEIRDGRIYDYPGNYSYFIEKRAQLLAETNNGNLSTKTKRVGQLKLKVKTLDKLRKQKEAKERNRIYQQNKDILDKLKSVEKKIRVFEKNKVGVESQLCDPVILKDSKKVQNLMIDLKKYNQQLSTLTKTHKNLILKIKKEY